MLPVGDDNSSRKSFPFMTYILIGINLVVFFLELSRGTDFIDKWAFIPSRFSSNPSGNFITIFTAMFMHAGGFHLFSNMLYLWIFGDNVEARFGHFRYVIFYLLSGVAATLAFLFFSLGSGTPLVGASGAIAGVLAAYFIMFPKRNIRVLMGLWLIPLPAWIVIGIWFVLQLFSGVASIDSAAQTGGVAYVAHVGGFVAGFVLTFVFRKKK